MQLMDIPQSWKEEFAFAAQLQLEKIREKTRATVFERLDHDQKEKQKFEEKRRKDVEEVEAALAKSEEIAAFHARLDSLDTATIQGLMDNGAALDSVHHDINRMLDDAYVLPDGRRVFKAEDGHHVFDERGSEIPSNVIDPGLIDERHVKWEGYKASRDMESRLQGERHDLLEFQAKLDAARERVDKGGMSKRQLDKLGDDLDNAMPPSLRKKVANEAAQHDRLGPSPQDGSTPAVTDDPVRRAWASPAPM